MKRSAFNKCLAGLLVLLSMVSVTRAQDPATYEVEIIVFRNLDQSANTPEAPSPRALMPPGSAAPTGSDFCAVDSAGGGAFLSF